MSTASRWRSSSKWASTASATAHTTDWRAAGVSVRHGPSNAWRAAATARSASSASPAASSAITSPVDGLMLGNVRPEAAGTHSPPISSSCFVVVDIGRSIACVHLLRRWRRGPPPR
jgi:hypothetical protein